MAKRRVSEPSAAVVPDSFESPESSLIARADYFRETHVMMLTLNSVRSVHGMPKKEEVLYRFDGFPENTWNEFAQAASKGTFFNKVIRPFWVGKEL